MRAEQAAAIEVDGHEVKITHAGKILFPQDGITKGDLIRYYQRIASWMLPHLEGRPLSMQRFPDGIGRPGFFQKAVAAYYPKWIRTATVKKVGGTVKHVVCDDAATLVYLANQGCITPHTWLSRADKLDRPDQMIFDLDPSTEDIAALIEAAHSFQEVLDDLELPAYLKSTGSRGLHVVVPLDRKQDFDAVREFARSVAGIVAARKPAQYTMEPYKAKRLGRIFLDVNRNAYAQTAAPAYAVRARNGAPVSVPLHWSELGKKFRPDGWTIRTIFDRLGKGEDPWKDFWRRAVSLDKARSVGQVPTRPH
jgi:bifunctional non-homologous end joining protein LigD